MTIAAEALAIPAALSRSAVGVARYGNRNSEHAVWRKEMGFDPGARPLPISAAH